MEYAGRPAVLCAALLFLLLAADIAGADRDFIIVKRFHGKRVPRQAGGAPVAQQIGSQWGSGGGSGSGGVPFAATVSAVPVLTTPPPAAQPPVQKKPEIYALDIKSTVTSRYAKTVVTSRLANKAGEAREAVFDVSLPKTAFISNFSMTIDNVTYFGEVKEKEKAEKEYKKAVSKGQSAGKVSARPKRENKFRVSVNVAAQSKVTFNLTYEELLQRRLGSYELVLSVRPQQVVRHLKIDVRIIETRDIVLLDVPNIRRSVADNTYGAGELEGAEISRPSPNRAHIQYRPSDLQQLRMSPAGISGDFLVRYDVKRDMSVGDIQIVNGYFVHYFAPSGLPVVPKNIVFVIDQSGSMQGTKMRQTKHAMNTILKDLREHDRFNVMAFSYSSTTWRPDEMVQATPENIESARTYVRREIRANGGTNINQAILDAADLLRRVTDGRPDSPRSASLIIFLTDGLPSSGETRTKNIMVTTHVILSLTLYVPNIRRSVADNTYGAGELEGAEISRPSPNRAHIQYRPSDLQQLRMSPAGISGDFLVRYDVKRDMSVGDIQIVNGYFVHYFAPSGLPVVPKNIVFVIDQSGSMQGTKMRQTKHAMNTILKDLREHDRFNVMAFSYSSTTWRPDEMVQATPENIESARTYVRREISANGGTNINQAILDAADLLRRVTDGRPDSPRSASLIIFLTDGLPSSGETRTKNIMVNVKNAIREQMSLFCLGFGNDVDFPFLEKMALENRGLGRRIYEDSDAALQLKGFYDEVATPLLFDVQMRYPENLVTDLTPVDFNTYFDGSLIIFLTDGLPSSGETRTKNIMVNVKNAIREQMSLFCLGFGNDVDFPFLEKMALENRGLGRRIYEDSDAALQLKGFYDEVATPLLFDVQMRYPENLVTDLTPVDFNTYFDGSELVVAGRLSNEVSRTLDVSVVGNTVDSQLTLEKEVNVTAPHKALLNPQAVGDFTQRLWAYLTIKHYLKQRLIAEPGEKTNLTAKALALSLKYNFVTPLTSMIVVKPDEEEVAEEEKETDGAADVPGGASSGPVPGSAFSGPGPVGVPGSAFPVSPGGAFPVSPVGVPGSAFPRRPVPGRPAFARPPPVRFAKGRGGGSQSVDGDPHFIVDMPGLNGTLCFDINGQAGDVLNLLRDRALGTVVNARVVAAKRVPEGKQKLPTYFGELSIAVGSIRIFITPKEILLLGRDPAHAQDLVIPWGKRSKLLRGPVNIDVRRRRMSVRHVGSGVEFVVLQHPVRADHPIKPDYLGFYVQNGKGLSTGVHGLIGQFHYGTANLHIDDDPLEGGVRKARIYIKDRKVEVHEKERRNHLINKRVRCWLAPNNADQLIDGHWRDYLVPDMFSLKDSQMAGNAVL
ncbi:PREDICTED: inter-alpha-trypsin inhibitor heavy chain H3-like [Branchiostoma belcheri]|uniref:Inter-alpha-trypsin inhibitor heavy chain H3-like n=1 Tax=Branchiostoma belcheri TaxID=7741 RepID=A0A6P4Y5H6_BRABE|nr:PREDICTED: inter-alpha-trypsin inhibitor heavy chain H3-like [Branchiostoma belcheri]